MEAGLPTGAGVADLFPEQNAVSHELQLVGNEEGEEHEEGREEGSVGLTYDSRWGPWGRGRLMEEVVFK
jgi:hypothetical protein